MRQGSAPLDGRGVRDRGRKIQSSLYTRVGHIHCKHFRQDHEEGTPSSSEKDLYC